MSRPAAIGLVAICLLCVSPISTSAKPNPKQSLEKLMVYFQNNDLNNIIRSSLYYQRQLQQILSNNPKSLHANLKREFYAEKKKAIFAQEDPNARGFGQDSLGRALFGGINVDPSDQIWNVLRLFKAGGTWQVTEVARGTANDELRRFPVHIGYVTFRFKNWKTAPIVENKYLKEAIVKIELDESAEYFMSLGRVGKGDAYWTGDVTPPVQCSAKAGGASLPENLFDKTTGMEFVLVPCGCYKMGDIFGDGNKDEKPAHDVCVSDFYLGKYEVTQGDWRKVTGNYFGNGIPRNRDPVFPVTWNEVQGFVARLNAVSGQMYRLPTEAEWEYAARSRGKAEKWPGTNNESDLKSYAVTDQIKRVGTAKPNGLGIYDMAGNVEEWCSDWYDENYYSSSFKNDPQGPPSGKQRVIRGGGPYWQPGILRTMSRSMQYPDFRGFSNFGFRLVRPATLKGLDTMGKPGEESSAPGAAGNCRTGYPVPVVELVGVEAKSIKKSEYTEYTLSVSNYRDYPDALFAPAPQLPPFDQNADSSRTWVEIVTDQKNLVAGYRTINKSVGLNRLAFTVPIMAWPPRTASVRLTDRECDRVYESKPVGIDVKSVPRAMPVTDQGENQRKAATSQSLARQPESPRNIANTHISRFETSNTSENPFKEGTKWVGDYACGQQTTELIIEIMTGREDDIKAIFKFNHSPTGARGSFYISGKYDSKEKKLRLLPGGWIEHPQGYQTVGMEGVILGNPTRYEGVILHPSCGKFSVRLK